MTEDWFTVEKLDADTWVISENRHWEEPHCYLLCGTERAALIDTGLGVAHLGTVVAQLTKLPVLVLTTHAHWDHIGSHADFDGFALHEAEVTWLTERFPIPRAVVISNLLRGNCRFPQDFSVEHYQIFQGTPQRILHDKDSVELGRRTLRVLHTPGHSPGHCCYWEPQRGYLFAGDLIYRGCLDAFYPSTDPVEFYHSVQKVRQLGAGRVFPAHHELLLPADFVSRIEEGFCRLEQDGMLKHGAGRFDFPDFQIHL